MFSTTYVCMIRLPTHNIMSKFIFTPTFEREICHYPITILLQHQENNPRSGNVSSVIELALESVATSMSGLYVCRAENVFGEVEKAVRIDVEGMPFIREITSPRQLVAGDSLEWFHCSYGGFPIDKITWYKDGRYCIIAALLHA